MSKEESVGTRGASMPLAQTSAQSSDQRDGAVDAIDSELAQARRTRRALCRAFELQAANTRYCESFHARALK